MAILHQFFKFLQMLHSETSTHQLSGGFLLGMCMGFTPTLTLHWFLYLVLLLMLRANIGAAMLSWALFKVLAFALDPMFHAVGLFALTQAPAITPFWASLYHAPIVPFTYFYNTIVMGSLIVQLAAAIPFFLLSGFLIKKYRQVVVARFKATWLFRAWKASKLSTLYDKYQQYKS